MKKIFLMAAAVLLLLDLCACGSSQNTNGINANDGLFPAESSSGAENETTEKTKIVYAFNGDGSSAGSFETLFEVFMEENPDIEVKLTFIPYSDWPDYISKIQTMVAGGTQIDACHMTNESCPIFYAYDMLLPFDRYIEEHGDTWFSYYDDLSKMCQSTYVKDGSVYGIAKDWNTVVVHFNTEMLEAAGLGVPAPTWNAEDFIEYCGKLTSEENGNKVFGTTLPLYYFGYTAWFYANGGRVFNEDFSQCIINSEENAEVLQLWHDLIWKYGYAPDPQYSEDAATSFLNEQTASHSAGHWSLSSYLSNDMEPGSVTVQTLPVMDGARYQPINGVGGTGVLNTTKHPEEAVRVAAWCGDDYFVNEVSSLNGYVPARTSMMESIVTSFDIYNNSQVFWEVADISFPCESTSTYGTDAETCTRYLTEILSDPNADIMEVLGRCAEELTQVRQNAR